MALQQEQDKVYTIDDIYELPEGTRAELIDGQIYYMAPPNRVHQVISMELSTTINNYIKKNKGTCRVFSAPFAVFLNEDDAKYIEPDISVICDPNKLNDKGCTGAPDWVIEIVSPGSRKKDKYIKLFKYRSAGVKEYWIIDPSKNIVTVHFFENDDSPNDFTFEDKIKVNIFNDFYIDFKELNIE